MSLLSTMRRVTYFTVCFVITLTACTTPKRLNVAGIGPAPLQDEKFDADIAELTGQLQQATNNDQRASLYSRRGSAFDLSGCHDEAIRDHTKALQLNPKLIDAYVGRGMAYEQKHEPDKAVRDFTTAIRLNVGTWQAYYMRGLAWVDVQQWNRAIADFDNAVKYNPQHADSFRQQARCYAQKKDLDSALNSFNAAIAVDPNDFTAHSGRGRLYALKGEWKKAEADHTTAIQNLRVPMKLYPKFLPSSVLAEVYLDRATAYINDDQLDKAASDCDAAVNLNSNAAEPYVRRATVYGKKKRYQMQLQDLQKAMRLNSQHADVAPNELAWFRATCPEAAMRKGKEAVELALKACALSNWKNLSYIDTLAAAYAEANDFDQAAKYEGRVLAGLDVKAPGRTDVRRRLELYRHHKSYRQEP